MFQAGKMFPPSFSLYLGSALSLPLYLVSCVSSACALCSVSVYLSLVLAFTRLSVPVDCSVSSSTEQRTSPNSGRTAHGMSP